MAAACGFAALLAGTAASAQQGPSAVPVVLEFVEPAPFGIWPPRPTHRVVARNVSGKVVVAWGAEVSRRDRGARLRPVTDVVVRPRLVGRSAQAALEGFAVPGPAPEYGARATFALFEDGTWAGRASLARTQIAAMRDEYAAVRAIGEVLARVPEQPTRTDLSRACAHLSRDLARASSPAARDAYETALTTLARALDDNVRGDRTLGQMLHLARDTVSRRLDAFALLAFVR
jgi:hypothetical protein